MTSKDRPTAPSSASSREERLAKALRENLARRKALQRSKRSRGDPETPSASAASAEAAPALAPGDDEGRT